MSRQMKFASLSLLLVLVAFIAAPFANGDEWDKKTVVNFSGPVEIPGRVLAPGSYILKRAQIQSDRDVVQFFNADDGKLVATIMAVPDYRLEPTADTVISFEERPSGSPEAVRSWFYPGENYGLKFVYRRSNSQLASNSQSAEPAAPPMNAIASAATSSESDPLPAILQQNQQQAEQDPQPMASADSSAQSDEASAATQEPQLTMAEDSAAQPESLPARLPKTASNLMVLPLIGLLFLCSGVMVLCGFRQATSRV